MPPGSPSRPGSRTRRRKVLAGTRIDRKLLEMKVHYPGRSADSVAAGRSSIEVLESPRSRTGGEPATAADRPRAAGGWSYGLATAVLIVVFLIANRPLVSGRATGLWDAEGYFTAMQIAVADHARNGRFMLWNPWCNAGSPDYADTASRRAVADLRDLRLPDRRQRGRLPVVLADDVARGRDRHAGPGPAPRRPGLGRPRRGPGIHLLRVLHRQRRAYLVDPRLRLPSLDHPALGRGVALPAGTGRRSWPVPSGVCRPWRATRV